MFTSLKKPFATIFVGDTVLSSLTGHGQETSLKVYHSKEAITHCLEILSLHARGRGANSVGQTEHSKPRVCNLTILLFYGGALGLGQSVLFDLLLCERIVFRPAGSFL